MSAHPPIIETADAFLGRLAALDMQAAEHVHACLMDATKPAEVAELARAYARASRCLRQTLALHARLKGDRDRAAREAERHAAQMAREAAALASRPDPAPAPDLDPDQAYFDEKVDDLHMAMERVVSKVADGDLARHTRLIHRFQRELDDWIEAPDFLETPLERLVERACRTLELPETLAGAWRDLPPATFFPEPEPRNARREEDDGPEAQDDPPDPGADPALRRGSG